MDISITVDFYQEICIECGVSYWMPTTLNQQRKKDKGNFYCPNGHAQSYSESVSERLQKQLKAKEEELARLKSRNVELRVAFDSRENEIGRLRKKLLKAKKAKK